MFWPLCVAILREVHYKGRINRDITKVCEPMHICKKLSFNNTWFKIHIKYKVQIKIFVISSSVQQRLNVASM